MKTLRTDLIEGVKYGKFTFTQKMVSAFELNNTIEREKNGRINFLNNPWNYDAEMFTEK